MADLVAPFQGERYAAVDRLSVLIAPPYDVIDPAERARYAALDRDNIVHIMLPEAPPGAPEEERHTAKRSAATLGRVAPYRCARTRSEASALRAGPRLHPADGGTPHAARRVRSRRRRGLRAAPDSAARTHPRGT